jgi:hypothetical protein
MNLENLLNQYNDRVAGTQWFPFVGFIESFHAELDTVSSSDADRRQLEIARERLQFQYLLNRDMHLFPRLIAAELLSLLIVDIRQLESAFTSLLERTQQRDHDKVVAISLSAHLMASTSTTTDIDTVLGPRNRDLVHQFFSLTRQRSQALGLQAPQPQSPPNMNSIRSLAGLLPGDCLFRRQSRPWYGNPFRDFGHAGMYIGCIDPTADVGDCEKHVVIHVISDTPACQQTTLHGFCNPDGGPEQFWGAYQADLTSGERSALVTAAYSLVGDCTYSFTNGYKNSAGKSFRCDGFVEHCYETCRPSQSPLSYRGGLFENDSWKTMNPQALRNCLTRKMASDLAPCCVSQVQPLGGALKALLSRGAKRNSGGRIPS